MRRLGINVVRTAPPLVRDNFCQSIPSNRQGRPGGPQKRLIDSTSANTVLEGKEISFKSFARQQAGGRGETPKKTLAAARAWSEQFAEEERRVMSSFDSLMSFNV